MKSKSSKKVEVAVTVMIVVAWFFAILTAQASSPDPVNYGLERSIGYAFL